MSDSVKNKKLSVWRVVQRGLWCNQIESDPICLTITIIIGFLVGLVIVSTLLFAIGFGYNYIYGTSDQCWTTKHVCFLHGVVILLYFMGLMVLNMLGAMSSCACSGSQDDMVYFGRTFIGLIVWELLSVVTATLSHWFRQCGIGQCETGFALTIGYCLVGYLVTGMIGYIPIYCYRKYHDNLPIVMDEIEQLTA